MKRGKFILLTLLSIAVVSFTTKAQEKLEKQAHRGGRGLMPENTITAMKNALDLGTNLEMDLYLSKDKKLVVSHDNRLSPNFVLDSNGIALTKENEKMYVLTKLNYQQIKKFDVGSKPNPDFPRKKNIPAYIPLFTELIDSVEAYAKTKHIKAPRYNVEAKIPNKEDLSDTLYRYEIIREMVNVIKKKKIQKRVIIQSFDIEALEILYREFPTIPASFLVSRNSLEVNLKKLTFIPQAYSPAYTLINKTLVNQCHQKGMKVIAWTPNKKEEIENLKAIGVDAIITDYPDLF